VLDTYFWINFSIQQKRNTLSLDLGPYSNLKEATCILVDFLPDYAKRIVNKGRYKYSASINECVLTQKNQWEIIHTPIRENECYKIGKQND